MFKLLLMTEFNANKVIIGLSLLANTIIFLVLSTAEKPDANRFIAATMMVFYIQLIALAIVAGEQKRTRLYAQLPVTASDAFFVGWLFVLTWLLAQCLIWILFGLLWSPEAIGIMISHCLAIAMGMAIFIAFVSIGIDLLSFQPRLVLWSYLAAMVLLIAVSIHLEFSFGVLTVAEEIRIFPFTHSGESSSNSLLTWLIAGSLFIGLFCTDWWVFKNSDNYLG